MKFVALALGATEVVALILNKNVTSKVLTNVTVHSKVLANVTVHSAAQVLTVPDEVQRKKQIRELKKANKALEAAEGASEFSPIEGTCEDNVMRCVYVHALPQDFCMKTHQPPWCQNYVDQPACVMVKNYDLYIEQYGEDNSELAPHTAEEEARNILSGHPKEVSDAQCFGTRGWNKPFGLSASETLPSCKSADSVGICNGHSDGKTWNCPICGEGAGQDKGAGGDNDIYR